MAASCCRRPAWSSWAVTARCTEPEPSPLTASRHNYPTAFSRRRGGCPPQWRALQRQRSEWVFFQAWRSGRPWIVVHEAGHFFARPPLAGHPRPSGFSIASAVRLLLEASQRPRGSVRPAGEFPLALVSPPLTMSAERQTQRQSRRHDPRSAAATALHQRALVNRAPACSPNLMLAPGRCWRPRELWWGIFRPVSAPNTRGGGAWVRWRPYSLASRRPPSRAWSPAIGSSASGGSHKPCWEAGGGGAGLVVTSIKGRPPRQTLDHGGASVQRQTLTLTLNPRRQRRHPRRKSAPSCNRRIGSEAFPAAAPGTTGR